ncbi:hypothetical protein [Segatella sp.]|uniref:hypothetical protein n=1 Tax=Segatella sp. TaxID=2974253 RepID=UPI003AB52546
MGNELLSKESNSDELIKIVGKEALQKLTNVGEKLGDNICKAIDWLYNRENETYNFSKRNVQFSHFFAPCFTIV